VRRLVGVLGVLVALVVAASPAQAAGTAFHHSTRGPGARALWTTFPTEGAPQPGVVYADTYLETAAAAVRDDGTRFEDKFLFVDQVRYTVDEAGNRIFVSETWGIAGGDDVSLTAPALSLKSASVTAEVPLTTCTGIEEPVCVDAGTATVHASWTGTGELERFGDVFRVTSNTITLVYRVQASFRREATATGGMNGTDFGTLLFAEISNVSSSEVFVCHGGC